MPTLCSKTKNLSVAQENRTKSAIKLSTKVLIYLILSFGLTIFCEELSEETIVTNGCI